MSDTLTYGCFLTADSDNPVSQYFYGTDIYIGEQFNSRLFGFGLKKKMESTAKSESMFLLLLPQPKTRIDLEEKYNFTAFNESGAIKIDNSGSMLSLENGKQELQFDDFIFANNLKKLA